MNGRRIENKQGAAPLPRPLETGFLNDASVDGIFERQAALCPRAVALQDGEVQWTYEKLNQRANQIARCLRAAGAQHESLVGVCLEGRLR
jgi:non-ribosomal peptide synthetase component F